MKSSPVLLAFYKAWIGETKHHRYTRRNGGLCPNLTEFMDAAFPGCIQAPVMEEMHKQFHAAGLPVSHPFNMDMSGYRQEVGLRCCHRNASRVQWVKNRIKDMEEVE